jgi:flagellar protein FliJ
MKDLKPLLKLCQQTTDERRRILAALLDAQAALIAERDQFEATILTEQAIAASDPLLAHGYDAFARRIIQTRERFAARLAGMEAQIAKAQASLAEAFQELKKFEQVEEERQQAVKLERKRRETHILDEAASIRFSRQDKGMDPIDD